jgi:adenine-specific DNA glycosylase
LLHGRYVCTARNPACPRCVIAELCGYAHKTAANTGGDPRPHERPRQAGVRRPASGG